MANEYAAIICRELNLKPRQTNAVLRLLEEGATIPFIARYRKEMTGSMDEVTIRNIQLRAGALAELDKRKAYIIDVIKELKKLTPELEQRIMETYEPSVLEDIYMPYRPKRRTRASVAISAGLEPLAKMIMAQSNGDIEKFASRFVKKDVPDLKAAIAGALDIIAEWISESEKARSIVRSKYNRSGVITSKVIKGKESEGNNYQNYFDFSEPLRTCTSHRYLAMRRGENEGILKVSIGIDDTEMNERLCRMFVKMGANEQCADLVRQAVKDGYRRLLKPSIETEVSLVMKEKSDTAAIALFADNVKQLLMAPPLGRKRVMAIDPGFRTGCKVVCLDEQGNLLAHDVVFPCAPVNDFYGAADTLCYMVDRFQIDAIAVGNGTAGRETDNFLQSVEFPRRVQIFMVSEQGASIYSASDVAREEFPDEDITVRGAVSIGRRLLDPLAELVKIDPKSIGVGQYQHDVNQTRLKDSLDFTVESCVNSVGVNVNTASKQLLGYVSGIGPVLAANIVKYRAENGYFKNRKQLLNIPRMGDKAFTQCAGFLRIPGSDNPLDNTGVHPERYELLEQMAKDMNTELERLVSNKSLLHNVDLERYVTKQVGMPTLVDIVKELEKNGRDPREKEDAVPFDAAVRSIEDLHMGMLVSGKVTNITAFGVFVDIGLKTNGLIHISQLSDKFITSPADVVRVGQIIKVRVIDVDVARSRVALSLKGLA